MMFTGKALMLSITKHIKVCFIANNSMVRILCDTLWLKGVICSYILFARSFKLPLYKKARYRPEDHFRWFLSPSHITCISMNPF